ncbi:MAG: urea ABC transporter permease subunit UrtC [Pirellulaceae bacterium]
MSEKQLSASMDRLRYYSGKLAPAITLTVGLIVVPALYLTGSIGIETVNMFGRFLAFAILAVSLDLVWGYMGILCLCQSLFFSFGGYAMGMHLALHGPLDGPGKTIPRALYVVSSSVEGIELPWFWQPFNSLSVTLLLGLLIPGVVAIIIGYCGFVSRIRGVFFAILTQAITFGAWLVFCRNDLMLCGTNGLTNFVTLAGFDLTVPNVKLGLYLVTLLTLIAVYWFCHVIVTSRLGRVMVAIRDNETRLRFSGYRPYVFKMLIFVLAGMIAGIAGMLFAPQANIFTPKFMEVKMSILAVIWVAVGGRGTLSGAVLGALAVNILYNTLTTQMPGSWPFVQGGMFIGIVLLCPEGLMSIWRRWTKQSSDPRGQASDEVVHRDAIDQRSPVADQGENAEDEYRKRLARLRVMQRISPGTSELDCVLLRIEKLQVEFDGFKALDIDSFTANHYELQVIIGPNGAGKTTLCDVISGKTHPTAGSVQFAAQEITGKSETDIARLGVGRKFQTPTVFDSLTVYENMQIASPGRQELKQNLWSKETDDEGKQILDILRRVRLIDHVDLPVKYLSHGQRQWLEISMLILAKPMLLLVDEPAAGLTDEETALTAELLLELQAEHSIIVIEHDMEFVRLLNAPVTVLNEGKVMAQGSLEELQSNPEVIEAYLGR